MVVAMKCPIFVASPIGETTRGKRASFMAVQDLLERARYLGPGEINRIVRLIYRITDVCSPHWSVMLAANDSYGMVAACYYLPTGEIYDVTTWEEWQELVRQVEYRAN